jgi:steroid delta-isomerase-like uncharacterized protein
MSEVNKVLVLRGWEEIVNQKNLDAFDEFYAADAVHHEPDQDLQGLEEVKQYTAMYFEAFPDMSVSVEDLIAEGDKVVSRYAYLGTHQGELQGIAPTNKHIEKEGITIHRIEGGKIVEEWEQYDKLSFLQQLGAVPEQ